MDAAESLFQCLELVADSRRARGVRHPFQVILRLTLLGLVCGQITMAHIALSPGCTVQCQGASGSIVRFGQLGGSLGQLPIRTIP